MWPALSASAAPRAPATERPVVASAVRVPDFDILCNDRRRRRCHRTSQYTRVRSLMSRDGPSVHGTLLDRYWPLMSRPPWTQGLARLLLRSNYLTNQTPSCNLGSERSGAGPRVAKKEERLRDESQTPARRQRAEERRLIFLRGGGGLGHVFFGLVLSTPFR